MSGSLTENADLHQVFLRSKQFALGFTWVRVSKIQPGSDIRQVRRSGVDMFKEQMRGGFSKQQSDYLTLYPSPQESCDVKEVFDEAKDKAKAAGVMLGYLECDRNLVDTPASVWYAGDGMHRATALKELFDEAKGADDHEKKLLYEWARAMVYTAGVRPYVCALSKAINTKDTAYVAEDNLERITFMQKMISTWVVNGWARKKCLDEDEDEENVFTDNVCSFLDELDIDAVREVNIRR